MFFTSRFIEGKPLSWKAGAPGQGLKQWVDQIVKQTRDLPVVQGACILRVTFVLTNEALRTAGPYGPDLDNLLKPFLDALEETVLGQNKDACIISLQATKTRKGPGLRPGALLEIVPVKAELMPQNDA